jgi:hypothetical protein
MSARTATGHVDDRDAAHKGCYVYGIVNADVEVLPQARGVGDPPVPVEVVSDGVVGALVSDVDVDEPLGRPEDLLAHERLLDAVVVEAPVLPLRFGALMTDREAVVKELLVPHDDEFADALGELAGRAQYVTRARYVEQTLLAELLAENATAADLAEQLRGRSAEETLDLRQQLGEIVNREVEARREVDTGSLIDALADVTVASAVRPPTHEEDAAHVAFLVDTSREREFLDAVDAVARDWEGRAQVRLLGPMAPYDFVVTTG